MKYKTKERKLAIEEADKQLLRLYFECKTLDEFKSKALTEHGYEMKFLDPFWLAYCYVSRPNWYWIVVNACCAILDIAIVTTLCCMTCLDVWWMLIPMIWPVAVGLFVFEPRRNKIITAVVRNEDMYSEIY